MIEAKVITDSISPSQNRLTTFLLRYPRFIHSEFMTHRLFSRNTSSSRALPAKNLIEEAELNPVAPIFWGKNQRGMQSFEQLDNVSITKAKAHWERARVRAIRQAKKLAEIGLHKQYVNRILEPFTHITVICTATDFGNFFNLRVHKDAMPEIIELSARMLVEYEKSVPDFKNPGEWHIPFGDKHLESLSSFAEEDRLPNLLKICTARAARVSYLTFDNKIDHQNDFKLHDSLANDGHWSPFEHCAQALYDSRQIANFKGWRQYRKFFFNEHRNTYNPNQLLREVGK